MEQIKKRIKVLHITSMYPSTAHPSLGSFVKSQIDSLQGLVDINLLVVQGLKGIWPYILAIPLLLRRLYFSSHDIIHVHYGNISSLVKLLYWGRKPIITSYCGDDLLGTIVDGERLSLKSRIFKKLNSFMSKRDSCSIVKSQILATKIVYAKRIELVPNGVDIKHFDEIAKENAKAKIGLADLNKKIILFPADPTIPVKNFKLIKDALSNFNEKEFHLLTFCGNNVSRDLIPYYFNSADLVVFSSLSEGSPNVIKEAMACNCIIYSTDCGDVSWLIEGAIGSKILPYNSSIWRKAISHYLHSSRSIQSNSRQLIMQRNLDSVSIAKKIVKIYHSVVSER